jgi:tetratricopeptide (TPR) repeat protein
MKKERHEGNGMRAGRRPTKRERYASSAAEGRRAVNMSSLSRKINSLFAREKWREARNLIGAELKKAPDDHWLLERLATTYYEERQYDEAWRLIKRAQKLKPDCPLVLWTLGNTLDMLGRPVEAAKIYFSLIKRAAKKRGLEQIANDECGEGVEWAKSLLVDCLYRLAICCEKMNKPKFKEAALKLFVRVSEFHKLGLRGIYSEAEVQERIKRLMGERDGLLTSELAEVTNELAAVL